jgi:hypothetical protein
MRETPEGYACRLHGVIEDHLTKREPKRDPVVRVKKSAAATRKKRPRDTRPKIRRGRTKIRFPSDLKMYPLPPSPDGRATDRTSPESPTTARSRLTPALMSEAVARAEKGETPWQIAGDLWERAGYASRHACKGSLYRALRAAGVRGQGGAA